MTNPELDAARDTVLGFGERVRGGQLLHWDELLDLTDAFGILNDAAMTGRYPSAWEPPITG